MGATHLTILAGPTVPVPLPPNIAERFREATVTETDDERSVFTLTFDAGRTAALGAFDTPLVTGSPLVAGARVVLMVTVGVLPEVLFDGIVTEVTLTPGSGPGSAVVQVTGEDVSILLDREEKDAEWPALDDLPQALVVLAPYAAQGIVPMVVPPLDMDPPLPIERVPTQHDTDLRHLVMLAERHGYVAYVLPGPVPGVSRFYWGPPIRVGVPQPAISVDLGPETNVVAAPTFTQSALAPVSVEGVVQDPRTGTTVPLRTGPSLQPPLAALPLWLTGAATVHRERFRESGTSTISAFARAQALVERSVNAVTGRGILDGAQYGAVLRPRGLVGVRGAGWSHDGLWFVKEVEHSLSPGSYRQRFVITREGYGSTVPVVIP
ncbi:hypothetical protein [Actinopolymorpha rutila]|uniref:Phage protein D n=1 Tax=Actinopolymorpha rutila TaxID=446787 RepID=A0A852ZG03_9ACTN|nr:hypothetical protein [Actinopolymorpha rutila]NYH90818.1 hypothetical protein [Actinopolymorpha rutila]